MSSSHVRLVVAGLSLILAVLTGLVTGFAGGTAETCDDAQAPVNPPNGGASAPAVFPEQSANGTVPSGPAGPGTENDPDRPPFGNDTFPTPGTNAFTLTHAGSGCERAFSPFLAVLGFGGALFTALVAVGLTLFMPRPPGVPTAPAAGAGIPTSAPPGRSRPMPGTGAAVGSATGSYPVLGDPLVAPAATLTTSAPVDRRVSAERRTLVETAIYVRDRATSKAIADRLAWALNEVGVLEVRPTGEVFDTAQHEAGGTLPTEDRRLDGTIAAVEIAGYTDRGQVVRAPVVTVYRAGSR
jgi:hypothetical protein